MKTEYVIESVFIECWLVYFLAEYLKKFNNLCIKRPLLGKVHGEIFLNFPDILSIA